MVAASKTPSSGLVIAALLSLYVIWGSTYYAMRVALQVLPPYLMGAPRFLIAGTLLFVVLRVRGATTPKPREWLAAGAIGTLLLVIGNGFVGLAERSVDSGTAATLVATMPLWLAAFGWLFGERPRPTEVLGLAFGFAGIVVLNGGGGFSLHGFDGLAILLSPVAWSLGSLWSRRLALPAGLMNTACQMILGGLIMFVVAAARGEQLSGPIRGATVAALGYLIVFGSLIAFSAYGFLLRATRPLIATSYAYVNPLVALGIGAALGGERLSARKLGACALTVLGVLVVTLSRHSAASARPAAAAR